MMEKLVINKLMSIKDSVSKLMNIKCRLTIDETTGSLVYEYENLDTGEADFITGDPKKGFRKLKYSRRSDLAIEKDFYGSGSLKYETDVFLGFPFPGKEKLQQYGRGFPLGISHEYNEKGKLVRQINNDLSFKFTLVDVKNYLLREYGKDFQSQEKYAGIERFVQNGNGFWVLKFFDPFEKAMVNVKLDGNSGDVLAKRKIIPYF